MYLDRILFPVQTLGPGNRAVLWTAGCSKHCPGCANPELWHTDGRKSYAPETISQILHQMHLDQKIDGITISGGDPLEQPEELLALLEQIQEITQDILVYTGYTLAELEQLPHFSAIRQQIAVLIDGRYLEQQNQISAVLRGSLNQKIHYFRPEYQPVYEAYLAEGRKIQNIWMGTQLISVGIHNRKESSA